MNTITIVGVIASICTAVSMVPQLIKLIKEKKADDISVFMLVVLFVGVGCWVMYGILKTDWIIIISNSSEPAPVSEIHFTPGTPFFARASFTFFF